MCLWQMVAFPQGDRKFPISALMQPTAENADRCVSVNQENLSHKACYLAMFTEALLLIE